MFKEIKFGSELHSRVLRAVLERKRMSVRKMEERHEEWDRAEKETISYIPARDAERKQKLRKEEASFTQLKIPYTYSLMMTAHTYYSSVFLGRSPIHQVQGVHGEGQNNVLAHEALMNYQVTKGRHTPAYFVWLLDVAKYGVGIVGDYWEKDIAQVSRIEDAPVENEGIIVPGRTVKKKVTERVTSFEGNKVFNVRPFDFFPDPRVALMNFQQGEFCGRQIRVGVNELIKGGINGKYFNVEEGKKSASLDSFQEGAGYGETGDNAALTEKAKGEDLVLTTEKDKDYLLLSEMFIELVPKDWGLGQSDYPEIWVFTLANDRVVVGAQPMGLYHNKFPFSVLEKEVDGHGLSSRGMPEIGMPLQQTMDWLYNSHSYNVQKAINNEFIVDPSMVNMRDFEDTRPGKMIRLKPMAYGKDVRTAVHQLTQVDYTQGHLRDMDVVQGLFQKVFGISDQLMGALNTTGRKTAAEIRTSASFGINRLKTDTEFFSATGWQSLTERFISNNQQLYTGEQKFRIAGSNIQGNEFLEVTPESIAGTYDIVPVDGTLPVDRMAQAQLWREIIGGIRNLPPQVAAGYDWAGIFSWMAKLAGLKNIDTFKVNNISPAANLSPISDQEAQAQAQAGNLVPTTEL